MRSSFAPVAVSLLAACTGPGDLPIGTTDQPIIGGTRSTGVISTVLIASYPPDRSVLLSCTGVLISPTVVLTAAHCVDTPNHPGHIFGVFTGDDATGTLAQLEPQLAAVNAVHAHPDYETGSPFYADIGVVVLAAPLAITPAEIHRAPIDQTIAGKTAEIIGYGQTVYQQFNQKRHAATTTVVGIEVDTVIVGDNQRHACLGDSGGPAFVDGKVIGVDSYGPVGCASPAHYRRTDAFLPFIDTYVPPPIIADGPNAANPEAGTDPVEDGGGCSTHGGAGLAVAALLIRRRRTRTA